MSDEHSFWARKETERGIGVIFFIWKNDCQKNWLFGLGYLADIFLKVYQNGLVTLK